MPKTPKPKSVVNLLSLFIARLTIRAVVVDASSYWSIAGHKVVTALIFIAKGNVASSAPSVLLIIFAAGRTTLDGKWVVCRAVPMICELTKF